MDLKESVAIVTGGSRGIGKAIALRLAIKGANIIFTYHSNESAANETVQDLETSGVQVKAIHADSADFNKARGIVDQTIKDFGRLDILVNNAGITADKPIFMMGEDDWDKVIETNLKGVFNYSRAASFHFLKEKKGHIVNITSVAGIMAVPGQANYCSSKAGVIQFTKTLAKECAKNNVRVNAIAPGYIETDMMNDIPEKKRNDLLSMVPMGRPGKAEEVADTVLFLLSQSAGYITGQTIVMDGGLTL